ncbi:MAG: integration host factor subunit alpha, partial [Candidatus Thioglobus sp.]
MSITKKNIANLLTQKNGISHSQAALLSNNFFATIKGKLAKGETVKLSGFGNFVIREKAQRPGRNPKTGKPAIISARKVVTFKAGS